MLGLMTKSSIILAGMHLGLPGKRQQGGGDVLKSMLCTGLLDFLKFPPELITPVFQSSVSPSN